MKILNYDNTEYDIIVVAGQSNAFGNGLGGTDNPWKEREDVLMLKNDFVTCHKRPTEDTVYIDINAQEDGYIEVAKERYDQRLDQTIGNFSLTFAKMYADKYLKDGRKALIVFTPVGGTGFVGKHWGQEDKLYLRMRDMVDSALKLNKNNKIVAYLWHQGEHDGYENRNLSYEGSRDFYDEKFTEFFNSIREIYGQNVPFICGGFTNDTIEEYRITTEAVIDVLKKKMEENKLTKYIDTSDLKSNKALGYKDPYHFCKRSLEVLGERYFNAFDQMIKEKQ